VVRISTQFIVKLNINYYLVEVFQVGGRNSKEKTCGYW